MAEIFLARQEGLEGFEKTICIKRIRPHLTSQPNFVQMFLNEAKLAAQLNHPNIAQIYDLGRINESYFIAMEYISGRDMSRIMPKAEQAGLSFPIVYSLKIASNVCDGLYYAHEKADTFGAPLNIVHRDVTPENVLVGFNGTVKIADFGIAKAATQLEQTQAGELKGKLSYMSPEQAMGEPLDHRSDLFSMGAVLYEWITGYKLFTGENEMAILKAIVEGRIYPPTYFNENVPPAVEAILMRALEKDREKRYQTAWDMQFEIDTYLASCEFTPSNIHLSNFIKQIFEDELEREKAHLVRLRQESLAEDKGAYDEINAEDVLDMDTVAGEMLLESSDIDSEGSSPRVRSPTSPGRQNSKLDAHMSFRLTSNEYQLLRSLADRHGLAPDALVRELVRQQLKWIRS